MRPPAGATHRRIGPDEQGVTSYSSWPDPQPVRPSPFDGKADIFDNQVAILEYANGVRGTFHTNCNTGTPERRFYLCGTEGTLRADVVAHTIGVVEALVPRASRIQQAVGTTATTPSSQLEETVKFFTAASACPLS